MKKSAAVLGILCLLCLTACRAQPSGGAGSATPSPPVQGDTPTQSSKPPAPTSTNAPQDTQTPAPTEAVPPPPVTTLTAQELAERALAWSEREAARFAGYHAFSLPAIYWFADYAAAGETVPYVAADGLDGSVFFLPDVDGTVTPEGAAAQLLGQSEGDLIVVNRERTLESLSRRMAALAEEKVTEEEAFERFLQAVQDIPALGEGMWYCVSTENTGYILQAHAGTYRLQRMVAMLEYAETPLFRVHIDFDKAAQAFLWFFGATLPLDPNATMTEGERTYFRVDFPGLSSVLELRTYLKTLFSDERVDDLLGSGVYIDVDGVLYGQPSTEEVSFPQEATVLQESATRIIYRLEADYVYEQVGERWLFTEFPVPA